jgi:hypothetical protein
MFETYDQKLIVFASYACFHELLPRCLGSRVNYNDLKNRYMFEGMSKTHCFCVLWPFSWAIAHTFGVPRGFSWHVRPDTCFRIITKKSSFLHFMVVFMSYCPQFLGSTVISNDRKTQYMFEAMTKNSSFSCFMDVFISYCP